MFGRRRRTFLEWMAAASATRGVGVTRPTRSSARFRRTLRRGDPTPRRAAGVGGRLEPGPEGAGGLGDPIGDFDPKLLATNPHIVHAESTRNGLAIVAIVAIGGDAVEVTFVAADDVTSRTGGVASEVSVHTPSGSRRVLPGLSAGRTRPGGSPA
jgi:hypothetical protein